MRTILCFILSSILAILLACGGISWATPSGQAVPAAEAAPPEGWFLAGSDPGSYTFELDGKIAKEGKSSARLASTARSTGFGTMMQSIAATEYLGKRLRLTSFVKAKDVKSWAGVWMRVDGPGNRSTAFDNMNQRPIKGTKDWVRYDVVLDVAADARAIAFGILVHGEGTVWLDGVKLEVVDTSVPTTSMTSQARKPENLDLER